MSIQYKKGKWSIELALKGFRPKRVPLTVDLCKDFLGKIYDPELDAKIHAWQSVLSFNTDKKILGEISKQMRELAGDKPKTRTKKALSEIGQWLNYLSINIASGK